MSPYRFSKVAFLLALMGAMSGSCSPASYEIIKPKKNKSVDQKGDPNTVTPVEPPVDSLPDGANVPPTARIEVIWEGQSVTKVRVNRPTVIRPTADTVDPDDLGKSQCANPGIVKADYDVGGEAKPVAERKQGCESLGVPYTFNTVGEYVIEMLVTSNENETAFASMTLEVISETAPLTVDGGFTIQAVPLLAKTGQDVAFYGFCQTKKAHTISWTYGDEGQGEGAETHHAYTAEGQYRVNAICTESVTNGRSWKASLTVVVIGTAVIIPGQPTGPTPPDGGDIGGSDDGTDPGNDGSDSDPGQGEPGQGEPGQGEPGQKLPWEQN